MKRANSRRSAFALALILGAATLVIWGEAAWFIVVRTAPHLPWRTRNLQYGLPQFIPADNIVVYPDGEVLIHSNEFIDGKTVSRSRTLENVPAKARPNTTGPRSGTTLYPTTDARHPPETHPWRKRISAFIVPPDIRQNRPPVREFWYFVHDGLREGTGYFVGYDALSQKRIGYWGTKGLMDQPPSVEDRFHCEPPRSHDSTKEPAEMRGYEVVMPLWLFGPDRLLEIDVPQRSVTTLWQGEHALDFESFGLGYVPAKGEEGPRTESRLVVRTENRLHFVNKDHKEEYAVEIPESLRQEVFRVWELPKEGVLVVADSSLGRPGVVVAKIPKSGAPTIIEFPKRYLFYSHPNDWPLLASVMPSPTLLTGYWAVGARNWRNSGRADNWSDAMWQEWPRFWPTLLGSLLVSAAFAVWVRRRHRQFGLGDENLWAAFVLLLGPLGAFAYFVHRAWPVREPCPACRALAPRDRDACFHCGAEFPGPERLSTEIRA